MADKTNSQDQEMDLDDINELDDELTSYGVFVKAGPEDVYEAQEEDSLSDLDEEEESLLADLQEEEIMLEEDGLLDLDDDSEGLESFGSDDPDFSAVNNDSVDLAADQDFSVDASESEEPEISLDDEELIGIADLDEESSEDDSDELEMTLDDELDIEDLESSSEADNDSLDIADSSDEDDLGDLGDLSDLEEEIALSLEEEEDGDTIYLEEDDLKLELDDHEDDLVLEGDEELEEDIVIPGLDDELEDITIPELDDEISVLDDDTPSDGDDFELDIEDLDDDTVSIKQSSEPDDEDLSPSDEASPGALESMDELDDLQDEDLLEDISIDEFMDKTAPENGDEDDSPLDSEDSFLELDDQQDALSTELPAEDLDIDIDLDEDILGLDSNEEDVDLDDSSLPGAEEDVVSLDDMPDTDYSEELDELGSDDELEAATPAENEGFDDVAAFSDSLSDSDDGDNGSMVDEALQLSDRESENILHSIESELSSIKSELTDLREELRRMRAGGESPAIQSAPTSANDQETATEDISQGYSHEESEGDGVDAGGFFSSDDDDETIALTGDELDNILNTAEFTEEAGESSINPDEDLSDSPAFEDAGGDDSQLTEISVDTAEDPFKGSEDEIQAMADLDIEEELQGIDDLSDDEDDIQLYTGDDLEEMELELPELADSDDVVDGEAEPLESDEVEIEDEILDLNEGEELDLSDDDESILIQETGADEDELEEITLDEIDDDIHPTEDLSAEEEELLGAGFEEEAPALDLSSEGDVEEIDLDSHDASPVQLSPDESQSREALSSDIKSEIKAVLTYMDSLLENLPEEKIEEFAQSEHFATYQKLFEELGL